MKSFCLLLVVIVVWGCGNREDRPSNESGKKSEREKQVNPRVEELSQQYLKTNPIYNTAVPWHDSSDLVVFYQENATDRAISLLNDSGVIKTLETRFSNSTKITDVQVATHPDLPKLITFLAKDSKWTVAYYWNPDTDSLYFSSAKQKTGSIFYSKNSSKIREQFLVFANPSIKKTQRDSARTTCLELERQGPDGKGFDPARDEITVSAHYLDNKLLHCNKVYYGQRAGTLGQNPPLEYLHVGPERLAAGGRKNRRAPGRYGGFDR